MEPAQVFIISPTLEHDAAGNFAKWLKSVKQTAASMLVDEYPPYGLLHLVVQPIIFAALPNAPNPIPDPQRPAPLAGGAAGGTVATYNEALAAYLRYQKHAALLKRVIVDSLSEDLKTAQRDPVTDIITISCLQIVDNITARHGVRNAYDISILLSKLHQPILGEDSETFLSFHTAFSTNVNQLALAGQPISPFQQIEYFKESTASQPAIVDSIHEYTKANPLVANRNLPNLIIFVTQQLANVTVRNAGFAAAVKPSGGGGPPPPGGSAPVTHDELRQVIKSLGDAIHDLQVSKRPSGKHSGRSYCYKHGYGTHKGIDCNVMKSNPTVFTDAMLKSTSPTMVPGGHN
jgi:hypothetical protein